MAFDERPLVEKLSEISEKRSVEEVASECDLIFTDDLNKWPGILSDDPFRAALDASRKENKTCMAIYGRYFTKITCDPTWMRALRLYQSMRD